MELQLESDFRPNFQHVILSCFVELASLLYIITKVKMSTYQPIQNWNKTHFKAQDIGWIVAKDPMWQIWPFLTRTSELIPLTSCLILLNFWPYNRTNFWQRRDHFIFIFHHLFPLWTYYHFTITSPIFNQGLHQHFFMYFSS
jgi:hypothetical protein